MLRQTVAYQKAFEVIVEEAPTEEDIMWKNIDSNLMLSYLRRALGDLCTLAITVLFAFPTAFISALNSIETMKTYFPRVDEWFAVSGGIVE